MNIPVELGVPVNIGLALMYVLAINPVIFLLKGTSTTGINAVSVMVANVTICDILILAIMFPYSIE